MYIIKSTQGVSRSALNLINNGNGQQNTNNKKYENNNQYTCIHAVAYRVCPVCVSGGLIS